MSEENKIKQLENKIAELEHANELNSNATRMMFQSRFEPNSEDEIDLAKLFGVIWEGKVKIILISAIFAIASVFYALSLPNIYTSTLKLVPTNQDSEGGLSSLAAKYGGLASMAGINLGGGSESNSVAHAVELMTSWPYIEAFVKKHDLKETLMATKGWNKDSNELIFDEELYDVKTKTWKTKQPWFSNEDKTAEPTSFETYEKVKKEFLSINFDDELGIFSISVNHYSPNIAYELTGKLKESINEYFRQQDRQEAQASIDFLENKIKSTNNAQMREVFYSMIESHTQKIMMTEVNEEYLLKTLIPAKVAEPKNKSKPKRALIVLLSTLVGGFLAVLFVLFSSYRKTKEV